MFKLVTVLLRGAAAASEEAFADRHALLILDQQMRDAAAALEAAKRALAFAIAQDGQEGKRLDTVLAKIADLEVRALAALEGGREDLTAEAAEAIASLEADRESIRTARTHFAAEISRLKRSVRDAERRITELERGRRIARSAEAVRRLRATVGRTGADRSALRDAEQTLKRLREKQAEAEAEDAALAGLDAETNADSIAQKLESSGFGPRTQPSGAEVLARLKRKAAGEAPPST